MKSNKEKVLDYILVGVLFLYLIFSNLSNHNFYGNIAIIILTFFSIAMILFKRKIYINKYFIFYLFFVIYQLLLIFLDKALSPSSTLNVLSTLMINFSILLMIYNVIIHLNSIEKILKIYIYASSISLAIIMFLLRNTLFTRRLAHAYGEGAISFYFLGNPIAISSNGIAFYTAISVLLCLYFFAKTKKINYLFLIVFLSLGCVMTGSRKGILVLIIYFILFINFLYKGKYLKKTIILMFLSIVFYFVIMKIPAIYNVIGIRLEAIFNKMVGIKTTEGSIVAREYYKNYALQMISKNPWTGYGCGYFAHEYGNVTEINYLEMLVSGGIIGLIIYYLNYCFILLNYVKNKKNLSDITNILFMAFFTIFIYDIGSVTYSVRSILIIVVLFISSIKLDQISLRGKDDEKS